MEVINTPGIRPRLYYKPIEDRYILQIHPHFVFGARTKHLFVTESELSAIKKWAGGHITIQEALPEWSNVKREYLLTGMSDEEFKEYMGAEDEDAAGHAEG